MKSPITVQLTGNQIANSLPDVSGCQDTSGGDLPRSVNIAFLLLDDPTEEANADADFHQIIYEAAHNVVLLHVMRVFSDFHRSEIFFSRLQLYRRPGVRDCLLEQHMAIAEAVLKGDPKTAEKSAAAHITFTFETLEEIRRDSERVEVSLRRVSRSDLLAGG